MCMCSDCDTIICKFITVCIYWMNQQKTHPLIDCGILRQCLFWMIITLNKFDKQFNIQVTYLWEWSEKIIYVTILIKLMTQVMIGQGFGLNIITNRWCSTGNISNLCESVFWQHIFVGPLAKWRQLVCVCNVTPSDSLVVYCV